MNDTAAPGFKHIRVAREDEAELEFLVQVEVPVRKVDQKEPEIRQSVAFDDLELVALGGGGLRHHGPDCRRIVA